MCIQFVDFEETDYQEIAGIVQGIETAWKDYNAVSYYALRNRKVAYAS